MIFPILNGWVGFARAPMTWALILLNLMMFSVTSRLGEGAQQDLERITRDDFFLKTQGRVYAEYNESHPAASSVINEIAAHVRDGDLSRAETLGQLAFRDEDFARAAGDLDFDGDRVAFGIWQKRLAEMRADQDAHPSFQLGVNVSHPSLSHWVTYIFVHSGALHLFGNMLFLWLFGAAVELQVGGLALLLTFLGAGVAAAGVFAVLTGFTSSPLVGASGAISGVMALYCVLNWTRPARYVWMLLPWRGYAGLVSLPAWTAIVLWGAADLAGFWATLPELGGVAHAAHLGGDLAGALIGLGLLLVRPARGAEPVTEEIATLRPF